jgi:hypothetical protein
LGAGRSGGGHRRLGGAAGRACGRGTGCAAAAGHRTRGGFVVGARQVTARGGRTGVVLVARAGCGAPGFAGAALALRGAGADGDALLLGGAQVVQPADLFAGDVLRLDRLLLAAPEQATAAAGLLTTPLGVVVGPVGTAGSHC